LLQGWRQCSLAHQGQWHGLQTTRRHVTELKDVCNWNKIKYRL
jgi:hypothetical protein